MTTAEISTDIVSLVEASPVLVLTDKDRFSQFYEAMRRECDAHEPDLSTDKGRKEIASLAYKVARTKTAIDDAGKKLNEQARAQISAVDESRREIRKQLDDLKDEVRRPLTEWEDAEKQREQDVAEELKFIRESARVDLDATSTDIIDRLNALSSLEIDEALHRDTAGIARQALADTVLALKAARDRIKREEADAAELERLRAAEEQRKQEEEEKRHQREYAESIMEHIRQCGLGMIGGKTYPYIILIRELEEKIPPEINSRLGDLEESARKLLEETLGRVKAAQAAQIERAREEAARIEQERLATIQKEAEDRAQAEAERKAQEAAEAKEREHKAALDAERRRAEEAEAASKAERDRIAREEEERRAEEKRLAEEQRKREADRTHRSKIMSGAKVAIMEAGSIDEATAKSIVLAIAAGNVPSITIAF